MADLFHILVLSALTTVVMPRTRGKYHASSLLKKNKVMVDASNGRQILA
jgi:hypothetical protein